MTTMFCEKCGEPTQRASHNGTRFVPLCNDCIQVLDAILDTLPWPAKDFTPDSDLEKVAWTVTNAFIATPFLSNHDKPNSQPSYVIYTFDSDHYYKYWDEKLGWVSYINDAFWFTTRAFALGQANLISQDQHIQVGVVAIAWIKEPSFSNLRQTANQS